jgi:hypothetical protein
MDKDYVQSTADVSGDPATAQHNTGYSNNKDVRTTICLPTTTMLLPWLLPLSPREGVRIWILWNMSGKER